jgi:hypothetical protein
MYRYQERLEELLSRNESLHEEHDSLLAAKAENIDFAKQRLADKSWLVMNFLIRVIRFYLNVCSKVLA